MSKHPDYNNMVKRAGEIYHEIEPDLPKLGQGHHAAAHDHVSDTLYNEFRKGLSDKKTHIAVTKATKEGLKDYVPSKKDERAAATERKRRLAQIAKKAAAEERAHARELKKREGSKPKSYADGAGNRSVTGYSFDLKKPPIRRIY